MELKHDPQGKPVIFSIKFIKSNGEIVYLPKAISCGLRANMKANRLRGVMPVDGNAEQTAHIYPVNIDAIIEFNNLKVTI